MDVAVLVSGGVDSSVALYQTVEAGHRAHGYYLKVWSETDALFAGDCPWEEDLYYAQSVCNQLGVPLTVVPLQQQYYDTIVAYTISELKAGATPSPDVFCNQRIKFGAFLDYLSHSSGSSNSTADSHRLQSPQKIVTGHYAQIKQHRSISYLHRARDATKDQSYFLSYLTHRQLDSLCFPLGSLTKQQVRTIARKHRLVTAGKPDSQGLCFLGSISYRQFISHYLGTKAGEIVNMKSGTTIGTHEGYWFYTIGQRKGLALPNGPWYVVDKDIERNIIYVDTDCTTMPNREIYLQTVWNNNTVTQQLLRNKRILIKYRHAPQVHRATVNSVDANSCRITVASETQPLAVGQQIALYLNRRCIGGGRISSFGHEVG